MNSSTELDAADPLAAHRSLFVRDDDVVAYLDGNSLGRPLRASAERISSFVTEQWASRLIRGWDEGWLELPTLVGDELGAAALGAAAGQVVVADSTTVILYKLVRAALAARPDRTEIVVSRDDFPTDRYIVEGIAAERGLTVRWIELGDELGVTPAALAEVVSDATAAVVLSHVGYRSGYLADMAALTAVAHDAGALVVWDLSHSVGSVPVELDACGADLATGCSYKYLNGGPGSPAFAYVRADLHDELRQPIRGWLGAAAPFDMGSSFTPADGIRSFTSGTPPIIGMLAMRDMIALIAEVGMEAIRAKSVALTGFAIELADEILPEATLATPRDAARRGSHITLDGGGFADIVPKLWRQGVIPDFRAPDGVRIGLSPLSTSFAEVELGMLAIRHPGA
ncbi:kynureninase [Marisediminicola sp. LYQ134]|uniref:kynureninase n=1 Tax=Marisediminicola sp. LYQ134 TaxID=3391061 RepID=UPI0039833C3A